MMKKIALSIAGMFMLVSGVVAQCIPDTAITHNVPGNYPDSLPHAVVGIPYTTTIQIKVLTDSTIMFGVIPIVAIVDSIDIINVTGMPPGFTYSCTPASCHFPGGSNACIYIQGPAPLTAGNYPLNVYLSIFGHAPIVGSTSILDTLTNYHLTVDQSIGIVNVPSLKFEVLQNSPNPFSVTSEISFSAPSNELISFKISNLLGKIVSTKTFVAQKGLNKIMLSAKDFESGIYFYTIANAKTSVTRRMIVSNE